MTRDQLKALFVAKENSYAAYMAHHQQNQSTNLDERFEMDMAMQKACRAQMAAADAYWAALREYEAQQ